MQKAWKNSLYCSDPISVKCCGDSHLQAAWCKLWSSTLVQQTVSYLKLTAIVCRNSETESCMEECCSQEMSVLFYCLKFKCLKIPPKTLPGSEHFKGPWNSAETASSPGGCLQGTNLPPTTFHRNCRKSGKPGKKGISIIFWTWLCNSSPGSHLRLQWVWGTLAVHLWEMRKRENERLLQIHQSYSTFNVWNKIWY